ncbi:sensor histidine kinase [Spongiactinospora sp. TRM90649]|uniref:sensor histidine kinase n=1 Tax=Spongiactinospora sp. TRM90649 TaxID=3031114 RepID=UPI0023F76D6B|nr:sensor histidine kinase [Spongiactinospora sp. TRM90649]MDF5754015.1 sensor histidine kinase [Spongiactinospora sp. TRM90649]
MRKTERRQGQRPLLGAPLSRRELIALDCAAALVLVLVLAGRPSSVAGMLVVFALGAPLAVRRAWPVPVLCVVLAAAVAAPFTGVSGGAFVAPSFAAYTVALTRPRRSGERGSGIAVLSGIVLFLLTVAGVPNGTMVPPLGELLLAVAVAGGAWTVGRAVRERRAHAARHAERLAERAVAGERLRIARELHDVVAHSMSLIAVKAGIANHVAAVRPEEAGEALRVIEATSRAALSEMRHMLGVLRSEPGDPPYDPAPGLSALPGLAERAASAGVVVETTVRGAEGVPEGVELSAYRIVQEALTNVVKHAAPATCTVVVDAAGGELRIDVTDDGRGGPPQEPSGTGHGLAGMRERVLLYGGALTAGPLPEGGFRVSARLRYREAE